MNQILETESTLTDRYQTTIPETVRDMLRLGKRDKLHYKIMSDGTVLLSHAESLQEADPVLVGFLALPAGDLAARPEAVLAMGTGRRARVRALTCGVAVDLDAPLNPADALNGQRQPGRGRQWLDHLRSSIVSEQLDALMAQVAALRQKDPAGYTSKNAFRRLAVIEKLVYEVIPHDPARAEYRQGDTLGGAHKHWFRAELFQQYWLFFRYALEARVIVFACVNDDPGKRAYGSAGDACAVSRRMLGSGHPPDDWPALQQEAKKSTCMSRR